MLLAAGIPIYRVSGGTVGQAVEAFRESQIEPISGAATAPRAGMGWRRAAGSTPGETPPSPEPRPEAAREDLTALKEEVRSLQEKLGDLLRRPGQIA